MWITPTDVRKVLNSTLTDDEIEIYIDLTETLFMNKFFVFEREISSKTSYLKLRFKNFLADTNRDWIADINDITLIDEHGNDLKPYIDNWKLYYESNFQVLEIQFNSSFDDLTFENIIIEYNNTYLDFSDEKIKKLLKLYLSWWTVLQILESNKLAIAENQITSWSLNGVSVSLDVGTIDSAIDYIKNTLKELEYYLPRAAIAFSRQNEHIWY